MEDIDTDAIKAATLLLIIIIIITGGVIMTWTHLAEKPYKNACLRNPEIMYDGKCLDTKSCLDQCINTLREKDHE